MFNHTREGRSIAGLVVKLVAIAAIALGSVAAQAGIANTRHNLGANNAANENYMTSGATEICVFCHTPHASNTNVTAPLWNKPVQAGSAYTTYTTATSATIDGSVDMSGISLACLSCHDGTQAMDTMINKPGSGGYNAAGSTITGGVWTGTRQSSGQMTNAGEFISMLGTDLTNDHPVGIQYCGGGISTGSATTTDASTGTCRDADFNAPTNAIIGGHRAWWVDTGGAGRQKTDMILYARVGALGSDSENGKYQPFVECASCHDPHTENTTFLRIANTNSAVCLACHNK
ncbi:MAG: hypothetical protein H6R14_296 [Proteobacteria bacterium]|nr:hypothetical protein [Pseudomonadota bacterium]